MCVFLRFGEVCLGNECERVPSELELIETSVNTGVRSSYVTDSVTRMLISPDLGSFGSSKLILELLS